MSAPAHGLPPRKARAGAAFAAAAASGLVGLALSGAATAIAAAVLGALTVFIVFEDVERYRVADAANLTLFLTGTLWSAIQAVSGGSTVAAALGGAVLAAAVCGGALYLLRVTHAALSGREGIGLGDVKFCAAAGTWVGIMQFPFVLLAASLAALVFVGLCSLLGSGWSRDRRLPFAAFLAPALLVVWLASQAGTGT